MDLQRIIPHVLLALALLTGCGLNLPPQVAIEYEQLPENLDFNVHVKPILSDKCFLCHGPDESKQEANLRLDLAEGAFAELSESPGKFAISPGKLGKSEVFHRIITDDPDYIMPSPNSNLHLTEREKAILIKWIEEGAVYKPHWAFLTPQAVDPPEVSHQDWVKTPIDQFIAKKLEKEDLSPSQEASKQVLLRRVTLDLTGLPPTEQEIQTFLADSSETAYETLVDRLLASPHYGEKIATDWLDLARYSDTHGYTVDYYRDVSPWRDWVIQAFNENMPYDRFIEWQLAGDLLPNPTREQILATTFNRLHPQNLEDGIIDEEFRVEYVADRTAVIGQGLMGLTTGCARCHDHKYDPVSQKNYFELFAFFNNVNEAGLIPREQSTPVPTLLLPTEKQEEILDFLERNVKEKETKLRSSRKTESDKATSWIEQGGYQSIPQSLPKKELQARFRLNKHLRNEINPSQAGNMDRAYSKAESPRFIPGYEQQGLLMDGDAWLDLDEIGVFQRKDPFSIGLWIQIPESLDEGVIFHKGQGTGLHGYRGYHVYLKDNQIEVMMSHTWPDNTIIKRSVEDLSRNEWVHLMLNYDGSSKSSGLDLYLNGKKMEMLTENDHLYKDIIFFDYEDAIYPEPIEPGLQIGARWRGLGIKGAMVDDILVYSRALSDLEIMTIADPIGQKALLATPPDHLNQDQRSLLQEYYLSRQSPAIRESQNDLQRARATLFDSLENIQEIMVMKEMDHPRQTHVLERGVYDAPGEEVFPNVPDKIFPWKEEFPSNRLGLAKWLTHPDHPLTARVAVNRYWQQYFAQGLVRTTEDFGNQGELPSHPELLDWLALEFIRSGWDVKALQKLIVMSSAYRQSSYASPELMEKDPENILLARGPKARLTSEMMRDNALLASGLLNRTIGGKSVKPYQPAGLWKMNSNTYVPDSGDKLYRRSLYSLWKRTVPNPTLATFDQPERSECTVRRQKTNTPLQALVLLNDPTYVEAAKVIGETITKEGSTAKSIASAYQRITGQQVSEEELKLFQALQSSQYESLNQHPKKAIGWLHAGEYPIDTSLDTLLVAANAIVASVILNSDASITKR